MLPSLASALLAPLLALNPFPWPGVPLAAPRLRAADPRLARLIDDSLHRSCTFAEMARRLEGSDVILHVVPSAELRPGVLARLVFVATAAPVRYLRAEILMQQGDVDLVATIAHELQHALEIAVRPDVRDEEGLRNLYLEIGHSHGLDRFETRTAQRVGWQVRSEVLAD